MKANLSKMLRSVLSLLLALCLVVGMVPAAFAAEMTEEEIQAAIEEVKELAKKAGYSDAEIEFALEAAKNAGYTEEEIATKYEDAKESGMTEEEIIEKMEEVKEENLTNVPASAAAYIKGLLNKVATMVTEDPKGTYDELYSVMSNRGYLDAAKKALAVLEAELAGVPGVEAAVEELKAALADASVSDMVKAFSAVKEKVEAAVAAAKSSAEADAIKLAWKVFLADRIPAILNTLVFATKTIAAEYKDEVVAKAKELIAALELKLAELPAESKAELKDAVAELKAAVADFAAGNERAGCSDVLDAVDACVAAVKATGIDAGEVLAKAKAVTIAAAKAVYERYIAATHDFYTVTYGSSYVALGDASAVSNSYVDQVAKELHLHTTNLADAEMKTVGDTFAVIEANAATIAAADMITIGYGNNAFAINAMNEVIGGATLDIDWAEKVGEKAATAIAIALNDIKEYLVENGASEDDAALAAAAVEAYAYSAASYAYNMPKLVEAVRAINADAVVVMVGMYNPLENISINLKGINVGIGEYLDYLVDLVAVHGLGYAMLTQNAIYVNAPAVETEYEAAGKSNTMDAVALFDYIATNGAEMNASNAGDEYIKEQILNALTIDYRGIYRLWGDTRFETAIKVADEMKYLNNIEKFETMIIASGENYPDALAGTYLATAKEAPILLSFLNDFTADRKYDNQTADYVAANLAENGTVYILGGTAAVSEEMETLLANRGVANVKRLGGANRFETNKLILDEVGVEGEEILVCTGSNFADTLAASATKLPILLVYNKTGLFDYQEEFLAGLNGNAVTILGGTSAVSEDVEAAVEAAAKVEADRVGGATRIETSIAVAQKYFPGNVQMVLATGWEFADALCGGSLAATQDAPVVLTMGALKDLSFTQSWNYGGLVYEQYVGPQGLNQGIILGGTAERCIPDDLARACYDLPADALIYVK